MKLQSAVSLVLLLAVRSTAAASDFTDFRIPDHRWVRTSAALGMDATSQDHGFGSAFSSFRDLEGTVSGTRDWNRDSDPRQWSFGIQAGVAGRRVTQWSNR